MCLNKQVVPPPIFLPNSIKKTIPPKMVSNRKIQVAIGSATWSKLPMPYVRIIRSVSRMWTRCGDDRMGPPGTHL